MVIAGGEGGVTVVLVFCNGGAKILQMKAIMLIVVYTFIPDHIIAYLDTV